jgi:phenylacetate-CoA ligase
MGDKMNMTNYNLFESLPAPVRKKFKNLYYALYETVPQSLLMRKGYFRVIELMQNPEIYDEKSAFVESTQRDLLTKVLKNALLNVPYYRNRVNFSPDDIEPANALEVLKKFPLLDKNEIMKCPEDFISDQVNKRTLYCASSGGSTGDVIKVWRTLEELQIERAFFDHMWSSYGYNQKSKVLRMGANSVVPLDMPPFQIVGRRLLVSPPHLNEKWMEKIVEKITDFDPEFIHAYPSCVERLALYLKAKNDSIKVKGIFLASEEVKPRQIEVFKEIFNVPICFHYGATEQVLLGYGSYIDNNIVYNFSPLYGIVENYLDEKGNYEMVGTGLWVYAMPLIRYRTQDYGIISDVNSGYKIGGKKWKTAIHLDGRKQNCLITKQKTSYFECSLPIDEIIGDYAKMFQCVQNFPGEFEVRVIPSEKYSDEIEQKIITMLKAEFSEWFDVKFLKVNEIPLTKSGKRRLVVVNHVFNQKR